MISTITYPPKFPLPAMGGYRYFFNGQEADNEVLGEGALHAFEYRMHDTRIGRFWSVDPLAAKFPWNSAYAFAENRVVDGRELEGLEWDPNKPLTTTSEQLSVQVVTAIDNTNVATTNNPWFQTNPCGEIMEPKNLSKFELWLQTPSKSTVDYTFKSLANFGYSYVNAPYSLFFGKTISGSSLIPKQRMDAFVDFVPGIERSDFLETNHSHRKRIARIQQFCKRKQSNWNTTYTNRSPNRYEVANRNGNDVPSEQEEHANAG